MADLRASLRLQDEDDLLMFQEKFLQEMKNSSSAAPAAKVMRVAPPAVLPDRDVVSLGLPSMLPSPSSKPSASRPSKFAQSRSNNKNSTNSTQTPSNSATSPASPSPKPAIPSLEKVQVKDSLAGHGAAPNENIEESEEDDDEDMYEELDDNPYDRMEREDTHMSSVLTKIQERDTANFSHQFPKFKSIPFPEAVHRSLKPTPRATTQSAVPAQIIEKPPSPSPSAVTKTPDLAQQIHQENTKKIESMSVNEISAAQHDILKSLDPSLINMLRNRKSGSRNAPSQPPTQSPVQTPAQAIQSSINLPIVPQPSIQTQTPPTSTQLAPAPTQPTPTSTESTSPAHSTLTQPDYPISTPSSDSNLVPSSVAQPLGIMTPQEQEELRKQRQEKRKKHQEDQLQEMRGEFEQNNKSVIELAEGEKAHEEAGVPEGDIATWRFDFDGNFVEQGSKIPAHIGLHHHGDAQSEAGYTLGELHSLARSTFSGQKILALKTLANILSNPSKEKYNSELHSHIFQLKFPRLFRAALDDMNPAVISATVDALHALVVDVAWEKQTILLSHRYRGHEGLPLHPVTAHQGKIGPKTKDDEEPELDDDEYLRADLVKGLLRTNLLNRLRYLLEVVKIPATAVPIIEILTHIARHSPDAAKEIFTCSRMVECLMTEFVKVPCELGLLKEATPYSTPLVQALRLLSVLCQSSRQIADSMTKPEFMADITRFVEAVQSNRSPIAIELFCEGLFMWKIMSSYGIQVECIQRVAFLFELVQNWSPTAIPDVAACSIVAELYNMLEVTTHAPPPLADKVSLSFDQIAFFVNPALGLLGNVDLSDASQIHFTNTAASMLHFLASYQNINERGNNGQRREAEDYGKRRRSWREGGRRR